MESPNSTNEQAGSNRIHWIYLATAFILVPISSAIVGWFSTRSEVKMEYVRIATGILGQKVPEGEDQEAVRTWAADLLQEFTPVEQTQPQIEKLISGESRTSPVGYGYETYNFGDYDTYEYGDFSHARNPGQEPSKKISGTGE